MEAIAVRPARPARRRTWLLLMALCGLLLLAGGLLLTRAAEETIVARAAKLLEAGQTESAAAALTPLYGKRFLSAETRRRAAALAFRLGEDQKGHHLLGAMPFREEDPADRRLRELSARAQRAASHLKAAEASREPGERLRRLRQAREEVPESPAVLQRLVEAELLALAAGPDPELEKEFEQDYFELRATAPRLAAEVKENVRKLLGEQESASTAGDAL